MNLVGLHLLLFHCGANRFGSRVAHVMVPHGHHGRRIAAAHARRVNHTHLGRVSPVSQCFMECACTRQLAGERIADPQGDCRWRRLFIVNNIEVCVERGRFINVGHGQVHERRKGPQTGHGEVAVGILNQMQVLDQSIAMTQ
jgi:hypothetical protein